MVSFGRTNTVWGDMENRVSGEATACRARVLLVDDDHLVRRAMVRSLGRTFDVTAACGGPEALDLLLADSRFDLVVADLNMPTMSGVAFLGEVRRRLPSMAHRLVLMSGAVDDRPEWVDVRQEEEVVLMHKPVATADLVRMLPPTAAALVQGVPGVS